MSDGCGCVVLVGVGACVLLALSALFGGAVGPGLGYLLVAGVLFVVAMFFFED